VKPSTLAAAALAAVIVSGAAEAAWAQSSDPVFAAFHEACVATGAEPTGVIKATEAHGWRNGDVAGKPIDGFKVDAKASKSKKVGDAELKLFAWQGSKGGIQADECQVQASKAGFEAVRAAVATTLGFSAQEASSPDKVVFSYAGPLDAPKPIDKSQYDAAAGTGGAFLLSITKQGSGVFLELTRYRK
jgi:hypothetical protein